MTQFNPIITAVDDGLIIPEIRLWSEYKYKLIGAYCNMFTKSMRRKWDNLVYIDLFAGAGYTKIKERNSIIKSSALIACSIPTIFDKYIFCEEDIDKLNALKNRIEREYPKLDVTYFHGDCNLMIPEIRNTIPKYSKGNTVLPFCFVDPYSLNLKFNTIRSLAGDCLMDFLILLALHMDANRNFKTYLNQNSNKIAQFLGIDSWREQFEAVNYSQKDFVKFLFDQYSSQMKSIGYVDPEHPHQVRSNEKNLPLYYLSFYSKHPLGNEFFKKIEPYITHQFKLNI